MAATVAATAADLAGAAVALMRMVDETREQGDVETLDGLAGVLLGDVEGLPAGRTDLERKTLARAVSAVKTARIHLARAGVHVPLARGLVLVSAALTDAAGHLEAMR